MREAVDDRGMGVLVPDSGARAAEQLSRSMLGEDSPDTFDPLMWMHMQLWARSSQTLTTIGADPMMTMYDWSSLADADPAFVEAAGCPLCVLDLLAYEHDVGCSDAACQKEPGPITDGWVSKCADAALEHYRGISS
jgi:hypothetical protein